MGSVVRTVNKRILIVGTVPYNKATTARAFEAYFHGWDRSCLAQIFSNPKKPVRGHCEKLYQITDKRMLQRFLGKKVQTGKCFFYEQLEESWSDYDKEVGGGIYKRLYDWGTRKSPFIHLLRGILWRKKNWCTKELNAWLDEFRPECVFLAFSNDYFIPRIALYVAERYNIPIVSCIGDDYYFNEKFSLSPLYHLYISTYRQLIRKVFAHGGSAIYISDKIRDKYNSEFGLDGETVYLVSEQERRPFRPIDREKPVISYFGNIGLGRNESLNEIGKALGQISPNHRLRIYSGELDPQMIRVFEGNPNVEFCGSISYEEVQKQMTMSDILVIVESFQPEYVAATRYSLSTKAADSLASGVQILVYGSPECGVIEYMSETESAAVCTDRIQLTGCIRQLMENEELQKRYYDNAIKVSKKNHTLESSTAVFRKVTEKTIERYGDRF